jgi:hypothetical protein
MITYVLTISTKFPATHKKAGLPTNFPTAIKHYDKLHTIRGNYLLWKKRFEKIDAGKAILSVRIWEGKPYAKGSTHREIFRYDKMHGIGIELLAFSEKIKTPYDCIVTKKGSVFKPDLHRLDLLARNDGLDIDDFKDWFKSYDLSKPMAIIHFTNFRYKN